MRSKLEKHDSGAEMSPFVVIESVNPASALQTEAAVDRKVQELVTEALEGHVWLPNYIDAFVKNGWVTLTGLVTWDFERMSAVHNIKKIEGVRGIQCKIELNQPWVYDDLKQSIATALKQQVRLELAATYAITPNVKSTLPKKTFMA